MGNICGTQNIEAQQAYTQPSLVLDSAQKFSRPQDVQTDTNSECVTQATSAELAETRKELEMECEIEQEDLKRNMADSEMANAEEIGTNTVATENMIAVPKMEPKEQALKDTAVEEVVDAKTATEMTDVQDAIEAKEAKHVKDVNDAPDNESQQETKQDSASVDVARPKSRMDTSAGPPEWIVIGGGEKGGIVVRKGKRISSKELPRLMVGARIQELERSGERVHFEKKAGTGPKNGWVSANINGKDLLQRA